MFTGIIEEIGIIKKIEVNGTGKNLTISCSKILSDANTGDSVSINGVCQTISAFNKEEFTVFVSNVSLQVTTLNDVNVGMKVNLERAMTLQKRFGGHIVQGHVDGKGIVVSYTQDNNGIEIKIRIDKEMSRYIVKKGSIAVNGVSLTIVDIKENIFTLYLIPESIKNTTFELLKVSDSVNIEVDILAKYIEKMSGRDKTREQNDLKRKIIEGGF